MLRHFSLVPRGYLWMNALKHTPLASPWFLVEGINKESKRRKMAPKKKPESDPSGMFSGMVVFLVTKGVQVRRLQIWKERLVQMGAVIEERLCKRVTHVFAMNSDALLQQLDRELLTRFKGRVLIYQWLEDCLKSGEIVSEDMYVLNLNSQGKPEKSWDPQPCQSDPQHLHNNKKTKYTEIINNESNDQGGKNVSLLSTSSHEEGDSLSYGNTGPQHLDSESDDSSSSYCPPDQNKNITEIFGKLVTIYRALGDDRRSFSYYKAIAVIEKLPFKIESADQINNLPSIGKSLKDHIQEIITSGKLSKLEHFEADEKVRTISLFGEVWGIGPSTALKLYEKGHRSLDDLRNDGSLTNAQKLGLKYFDDIRQRIPRHEVVIICGGSYRRGKATCGDIDIIITHPDGQRQGSDSGVDTYFGFCTYPRQELRRRIDLKVYPRHIYAFGLIAWTGNDVLNRRLRLLAESKGFRLDDTGLFPATHGSGSKRGAKGSASLKFNTEKEVFHFLDFPWLEPHERNL
ncbi:DNA polymerase lambda isoform X4 [Vigna angularis]|uniref:DNA polymerase lambda isoform X4 n=1 Tax=Phaseolus angularis TaxID=3914 RepID=UPI0022B4D258|nr:DNA polymerase lambda isoform X4 [Vigna angularis]